MVEQDEDSDDYTGDQGDAPYLRNMMRLRVNVQMSGWGVLRIMTLIYIG